MQVICETTDAVIKPCVATIGFFDGVHVGHRYLIRQVKNLADAKGLRAAVVTFPVHPRNVMKADYRPELLTTCAEKVRLLSDTGIDDCFMLDFTPEISRLTAREFMVQILKERYNVQCLVIGYDHRFGYKRSEGFEDYCRYGAEIGIEVVRAHAYTYININKEHSIETGASEKIHVSSSLIREYLHRGEVDKAAAYLGYEYFLEGMVIDGHKVGRKIGFPTANLHITDSGKLIPSDGVYAVRVYIDGQKYMGMLNIGFRPTVNNGLDRTIEVNILHFNADIYNKVIRIVFVKRTRPEMKFDTIEQLIARMHQDAEEIEALLS